MTTDSGDYTLKVFASIAEIPSADWDSCAGGANPFISHVFLKALEEAHCASAEAGWMPQHIVLQKNDQIRAVAPLYIKTHSYGEYIFDHNWAAAYERAGGQYYPKLQCAVPFTPVTGPRLLLRDKNNIQETELLSHGIAEAARQMQVSSVHITFCTEEEWKFLGEAGYLLRTSEQFHWDNANYTTFDDFLEQLSSRKRKQIKRERREAQTAGLTLEVHTGDDLREEHWDAMYRFYVDTGSRKWGTPYLNRQFFNLLHERMQDRIVLMLAKRNNQYIAGALNFLGSDTLYGRYWGCTEHHPYLHFELCYYQAIDYAITHRLARIEAGAQGEHKLARGYLPCLTYSAHWIADPGFARAISNYLQHERTAVMEGIEALAEHSPFRNEQD